MKKIGIFSIGLLLGSFLFQIPTMAKSDVSLKIDNKKTTGTEALVTVDGKELTCKFKPYTINGRTFVPIRELTESLGARVDWDSSTKSANVTMGDKNLKLQINSKVVYIDGKKQLIDEASIPKLAGYVVPSEEVKTMVPLRFLSESLGYRVDWNQENLEALITTDPTEIKRLKEEEEAKKKEEAKKQEADKKQEKKSVEKTEGKDNKKSNTDDNNSNGERVVSIEANKYVSNIEKSESNNIKKEGTLDEEVLKEAGLEKSDYEPKKITKKLKSDGRVTIVLDAGHGGKDSGALGKDNTKEKDLNLKVVTRLNRKLLEKGYEVLLTRDEDEYVKLLERAAVSNKNNAEIFLSVHFNSSTNPAASGIEVLYGSENTVKLKSVEQKHLSKELLDALVEETDAVNRGVKNRPDLVVLNTTRSVSALVELGFLSNSNDLEKVKEDEYIDLLVEGLYKGLNNYIEKYVEE